MARIIIYHGSCIDGFTAAWVADQHFGDEETRFIEANYGEAPPEVTEDDSVFVLDFSYSREETLRLHEIAGDLHVIDHHKTHREALEGLSYARFDMERSGAGLTWDFFFPGKPRPWLVDYVEDRDLWRFKLPRSKAVNAWIGATERDSFVRWSELNRAGVEVAGYNGMAVEHFVNRYVAEMCEQARWQNFEGHRIPVVNAPYINTSELVSHLAEQAPFAVGWFQRRDGQYQYSLRSRGPDGIDVSEIAKRYGGGGHKNAAGFVVAERVI